MRADRLDDRTAPNVAAANTSVPAPVAKEETVAQSTASETMACQFDRLLQASRLGRPKFWWRAWSPHVR